MNLPQILLSARNATEVITPDMGRDLIHSSPAQDYAVGLVRGARLVRGDPLPGDVIVSQALASGMVSAYRVEETLPDIGIHAEILQELCLV